jgi:multidrug resistance efflux pump
METEQQAEIKERIAELRNRYARLKAICGPQAISRETIAEYTKELQTLQAQLE